MPKRAKPPPQPKRPSGSRRRPNAPLVDARDRFARRNVDHVADEMRTRAIIAGKIKMVRRDPGLTAAQKAAAIRDLRARGRRRQDT
jgi:hypothetical protein